MNRGCSEELMSVFFGGVDKSESVYFSFFCVFPHFFINKNMMIYSIQR